MYFSDLPLGLRIVVFAAWLGLFLAGMAAVAWVVLRVFDWLPTEAAAPLGFAIMGLVAGFVVGGVITERSTLRRYAPEVWAAGASTRLQTRRDTLARVGILVVAFATGLIVFLVNKL